MLLLVILDRKGDEAKWSHPLQFDMDGDLIQQIPPSPRGRLGETSGVLKRFGWRGYTDAYLEHPYAPEILPAHSLYNDITSFLVNLFPNLNLKLLRNKSK